MKQKNCKGSCKADYSQERVKGLSYYSQEYIYFLPILQKAQSFYLYVRKTLEKESPVRKTIYSRL